MPSLLHCRFLLFYYDAMKNLYVSLLILTAFISCRRDDDHTTLSASFTDPLNIFRINVYRSSKPAEILAAPFINSRPDIGKLMIFDEQGYLKMQKETPGATYCFNKWNINGVVRYSYIVNDITARQLPTPYGALTGYAVITDERLNEIKRIHLQTNKDVSFVKGGPDLDIHDFILISDDHYITMAYYPKKPTNIPASLHPHPNVTVLSPIIQEIKNGQVIWQWDGTDHPEFYTTSVEGNNFSDSVVAQDYMHLNSMVIDPSDNTLICSFRNLDQVIKINRGTGTILWRLGGKNSNFSLSATQQFFRQHHATLTDDNKTLLLFDNGVVPLRPFSRILEFQLNEGLKTVTSFKLYNIPASFSQFMGSVQKIDGHYFIDGGTAGYIVEIDPLTNERYIEFTGDKPTYRAYKFNKTF